MCQSPFKLKETNPLESGLSQSQSLSLLGEVCLLELGLSLLGVSDGNDALTLIHWTADNKLVLCLHHPSYVSLCPI